MITSLRSQLGLLRERMLPVKGGREVKNSVSRRRLRVRAPHPEPFFHYLQIAIQETLAPRMARPLRPG